MSDVIRPSDFSHQVRESWANHEAFRRLGFSADEIFVAVDVVRAYTVLRAQGLEFVVVLGDIEDGFLDGWSMFAECSNRNAFAEEDLQEVWEESWVKNNSVCLVTAMTDKGFSFVEQKRINDEQASEIDKEQ